MTQIRRDVRLGTIAAIPKLNGLSIADGITINEWLEIGTELEKLGDSSAWWIGDWLAYGDRYRRDYHDAMAQVDVRWSSARVYRWVSQRVHPDRRHTKLSWSHHQAVARLEPQEQIELLFDAHNGGWGHRELRDVVARRIEARTEPKPPALAVKATGQLYDLCSRAAAHAGVPAAQWAQQALERAALHELGETPHPLAPEAA